MHWKKHGIVLVMAQDLTASATWSTVPPLMDFRRSKSLPVIDTRAMLATKRSSSAVKKQIPMSTPKKREQAYLFKRKNWAVPMMGMEAVF